MSSAEAVIATATKQRAPYWGLAIAVLLLAVVGVSAYSARDTLSQLAASLFVLTPSDLAVLLPFAIWSYGLRIVRWHILLRRLVPRVPIRLSLHSQVVGFAFAATPGRIAELYKLRMVERSVGLPPAQSLPAVAVERLTDLAAFASLAVVGGWLSWTAWGSSGQADRWLVLGLGAAALVAIYGLSVRRWPGWRHSAAIGSAQSWLGGQMWRLPAARRLSSLVDQFRSGARLVASPRTLIAALALVIAGRLGDAVVIWQVARILGYEIPFPLAVLLIAAAGLAGGLSLSPGGLGAAEAALVGLVFAEGIPLQSAVTIALLSRALIFWGWIALGLLVFGAGLVAGAIVVGARDAAGALWRRGDADDADDTDDAGDVDKAA